MRAWQLPCACGPRDRNFEIVQQKREPALPGDVGELVITSLSVEDAAPCGIAPQEFGAAREKRPSDLLMWSHSTVIAKVLGALESGVTVDGRQIGMFSYRTIKHVPGIGKSRSCRSRRCAFQSAAVPTVHAPPPK